MPTELTPEELAVAQERANNMDLLGNGSSQQEAEYAAESQRLSEAASFGDEVAASLRLGPGVAMYQWNARAEIPYDPSFKLADHWDELKNGIPALYYPEFSGVRSLPEARQLKRDIEMRLADSRVLEHSGIGGFAAQVVPAFADPINIITGRAFFAGKLGNVAGPLRGATNLPARLVTGAAAGFEAGIVSEGTTQAFAPEPTNLGAIVDVGLTTMAMGAAMHGHVGVAKAVDSAREEFAARPDVPPPADGPVFTEPLKEQPKESQTQQEAATPKPNDMQDSVGAASVYPDHIINDTVDLGGEAQQYRDQARRFLYRNNIDAQYEAAFKDTAAGKSSKALHSFISNNKLLASDWDRLWNSGGSIAKVVNYKLFESPASLVVNNKSASILTPQYETRMNAGVMISYDHTLTDYLKQSGKGWASLNPETVRKFHREVIDELNARLHDGPGHTPSTNPAIKQMADAIDAGAAEAHKIMTGLPGETAVHGVENFQPRPGWFRQIWDGEKMSRLIKEKPALKTQIESALARTYMQLYPNMKAELADIYSKAVVRGALARTMDFDTNMARFLSQDGKEVAMQVLKDNGLSVKQATDVIDAIRQASPDVGKLGAMKARLDVDLRTPIDAEGLTLADLVNTDIPHIWQRYSRQVAGISAMARHGIQKQEIPGLIDAILKELEVVGKPGHVSKQDLQDMFSYFSGSAFGGGVSPWVRRALGLTNLALLGGMSLTQMAEIGVQVATVGTEAFMKTAPKELKDMIARKDTASMTQLKHALSPIIGEDKVMHSHLSLEELSANAGQLAELGKLIDTGLSEGRKIQGRVSLFYKIKQAQERIAIRAMLYRLNQHFTTDKKLDPTRLYSLGITNPKLEERIGKYFKNGTVKVVDGDIVDLGHASWKTSDFQELTSVLQRHVGQVVQQINRGEGSIYFNKDVGAVLYHLKKFPLVAIQKQLLRNTRVMDEEALAGIAYGLGTAALVYTAKQVLAGNNDKLNPLDIAKGGIALGNMTGWFPMATDPLMSILGQDNLRFSQYGPTGASTGVLDVPPVIPTLNRIAHIPTAAAAAFMGNADKSDISALKAVPIFGNLTGMSYVWNSMLADHNKSTGTADKAEQAQQPTPPDQPKVVKPKITKQEKIDKSAQQLLHDLGIE